MDFTQTIEEHLGIKAKNEFLPMQPGDVKERYADIGELTEYGITIRPLVRNFRPQMLE